MGNFFQLIKTKFFSETERTVCRIAIPAIFEGILTTLATIIDTKMVGSLGSEAISAVSLTNQPRLFIMVIFFAISTVISILVANNYGRKDQKEANSIFFTGFIMSFILGVVICGISAICSRYFMYLFTFKHPELLNESSKYFSIVMIGSIFNAVFMSINAGLRGCGYTHLTFLCSLVSTVVNIFLNYLLIEGHWGAPALGVTGAAIATATGFAVATIVAIVFAFRKKYFVNFAFVIREKTFITIKHIKSIFRLFWKVLLENILTRIGFLFSGFVVGLLPSSVEISAYSIGMNYMNITLALGDGFSQSSVALVGKSCGEKDINKVKKYSSSSFRISLVLSTLLIVIYATLGSYIYGFFLKPTSPDYKQIVELGRVCSYILAAIVPIQIIQVVANGVVRGSGDVKFPLIAAFISVTIVNPLFAYLLAIYLGYGVIGIWISVLISQFVRMLLLVIYLPGKMKKIALEMKSN